jgi:hypothetical protein
MAPQADIFSTTGLGMWRCVNRSAVTKLRWRLRGELDWAIMWMYRYLLKLLMKAFNFALPIFRRT